MRLVEQYGPKRWSVIAMHLPGRIGKQCRERWVGWLVDTHNRCSVFFRGAYRLFFFSISSRNVFQLRSCDARPLPGRIGKQFRDRQVGGRMGGWVGGYLPSFQLCSYRCLTFRCFAYYFFCVLLAVVVSYVL